jgi:hypothetical protein
MHAKLGKRPMYLSNVAKEAQDTEAEAVNFRTSKSIPAEDRLKLQRRDKLVANSKRALLRNSAQKVENFLGYKTTDEAVSAVDAALGAGTLKHAIPGDGTVTDSERAPSSMEDLTELEALALNPAHRGPAMVTGKSAKKKKRDEHKRHRSRKALRHKQHTHHGKDGKTPQHKPKVDVLVTPTPEVSSSARSAKTSGRGSGVRDRNSAGTSRRRGSYFGMTTHGTTQRRKAANKAKLYGYANEYGVAIRPHGKTKHPDLHKGWTHAHTTSSHARSAGNYTGVDHRDHHENRRVKKRTAFGSTETIRTELGGSKNKAVREMSADDVAVLSLISSPTAASKRKGLEKGKSMATAEAQEREKEKLEGKLRADTNAQRVNNKKQLSRSGRKHRTPRGKNRHQGIKKGWSPAVIRGTSVTAHTHTSSSHVLAAPHHQQLNDSETVSEQQLEAGIESSLGL